MASFNTPRVAHSFIHFTKHSPGGVQLRFPPDEVQAPSLQVACKEVSCTGVNPSMHAALHVLPDAVVLEQVQLALLGRVVLGWVLQAAGPAAAVSPARRQRQHDTT